METVISVSAYNSKGKVVNGEWESILAETMIINNGDTIAIKDAYIDTRTRNSDDIYIEEDTTLILEYYYYYVFATTDESIMNIYAKIQPNILQSSTETLALLDMTTLNAVKLYCPDGLPYVLMAWYYPYNYVTHSYDTTVPLSWQPVVGKWEYTLKAGSYSKDYLATYLTKNMAKVKPNLYGKHCEPNFGLFNNFATYEDPNIVPGADNSPFIIQTGYRNVETGDNIQQFYIEIGWNPTVSTEPFDYVPGSNTNPIPCVLASLTTLKSNGGKTNLEFQGEANQEVQYVIFPIMEPTLIENTGGPNNGNASTLNNTGLEGLSIYFGPLIGASEISLLWSDQNNGIYSFDYLHSPILIGGKEVVIASTGTYQPGNIPFPSISMSDRQSGIIFAQITPTIFWQDTLGFDVPNIITAFVINQAENKIGINWDKYQSITTGNYWGAGMVNFNQAVIPIASQQYWFPLSFRDVLYRQWTINGYNGMISWEANTTNTLDAIQAPLNPNDTGHFLIEVNGYQTNFFDEKDAYQVKSIISSYYITANSFATAPFPDSFVYEHHGESIIIGALKIRILNPKTKKVLPIGPNSTVYLQITQQLTPERVQQPDF